MQTIRTGGPRLRKDGKPDMRFKFNRDWKAFFNLPVGSRFTIQKGGKAVSHVLLGKFDSFTAGEELKFGEAVRAGDDGKVYRAA